MQLHRAVGSTRFGGGRALAAGRLLRPAPVAFRLARHLSTRVSHSLTPDTLPAGELYHATRAGGAFLNGQPIRVSDTRELRKAVVATELGTRRDEGFMDACFDRMRALGQAARSLRCSGSCALNLCSVAMGR